MNTNSKREQILQAILATLKPVVEGACGTIHRSPVIAIERELTPAVIVFPEEEVVEFPKNQLVDRRLIVRVIALARELDGAAAEAMADRLMTACHEALFAQRNLGGLAQGIRELGAEWDMEDADAIAAAIPTRYEVIYRTLQADLTQ